MNPCDFYTILYSRLHLFLFLVLRAENTTSVSDASFSHRCHVALCSMWIASEIFSPQLCRTFNRCLLWEIDDRSGETAQLAFVSLAAAAARILLPTAALSSGRPTHSAISSDFSMLSENLYSPVPTGEPMYPRAVSELRLVAAELEEAMRAISLTLDGALKKSVAHVFSVGACVEWAYMSLMHHADVMEKDPIQNKSLELRMQCLVDLLYDTLVGTCGRKGMDRSTTAITSWPGSRTLGQPSSSTPSSSSPSPRSDGRKTSSVRNAEEVLHVLHSLTKHASSAVANMCRAVIRNLSSSSTPLPMAIIDHVEMLVSSWTSSDLTSDKNDHNAMATRRCYYCPPKSSVLFCAAMHCVMLLMYVIFMWKCGTLQLLIAENFLALLIAFLCFRIPLLL